jgi:hypothetical protein
VYSTDKLSSVPLSMMTVYMMGQSTRLLCNDTLHCSCRRPFWKYVNNKHAFWSYRLDCGYIII